MAVNTSWVRRSGRAISIQSRNVAAARNFPWIMGAFGVLALAVTAGCGKDAGPPTAHLSGTVTIGGKPIPADAQAAIVFRTTGGGQAPPKSAPITNGQFDVPDAPQGSVKVQFTILKPIGEKAFAPGATPEMQWESLIREEHAIGKTINIVGDDRNMQFDL